jgi:hypothetical protein
LPVIFSVKRVTKIVKDGPAGGRRPGEQKKSPGPDQNPLAVAEGTPEEDPGHAPQGPLVEKGQKGAGGGENRHDFVHVVGQVVQEGHLVQLAVFQDKRDILDGQHGEVDRKAEGHLGEHGVNVGVPENEPAAQRLADVDGQDQEGRTVADKADQDRVVDDVFKQVLAHHVTQKAGEKGAAAQGDDRQVGPDPEGEPVGSRSCWSGSNP